MNDTWYQEELLEHYRNPKNKKIITNASFISEEYNPSCGDAVCMMGLIDNNVVTDLGFQGKGCVISQAAASMLTELCITQNIDAITTMNEETIKNLVGLHLGPVRIKCALLPLMVLQQGIKNYHERIT